MMSKSLLYLGSVGFFCKCCRCNNMVVRGQGWFMTRHDALVAALGEGWRFICGMDDNVVLMCPDCLPSGVADRMPRVQVVKRS